jgi:anti-sigma B factor antagonist
MAPGIHPPHDRSENLDGPRRLRVWLPHNPGGMLPPNETGGTMIETEELAGGVTKVTLIGKLGIVEANAIDLPFNVVMGAKRAIIIDLSQVSYVASMGLRTLVMGAKTVASKRGRMVLLSPNADVEQVLLASGTNTLIPILHDLDAAVAAVTG